MTTSDPPPDRPLDSPSLKDPSLKDPSLRDPSLKEPPLKALPLKALPLQELVSRSHAGDEEAQRQLVREMEDVVRGVARSTLGNAPDAEDLTQNIFLAVFRGLGSFRGEAHLRTWIRSVARNEARKFLRTRLRREDPVRDADREPERLASKRFGDRLRERRIHAALTELPAGDREALHLVVFDGASYAEAGVALGCSAAAIRGRVYRARQELRQKLEES
ncbi:MAG: RNA polymerase sigma factor [Acidobacteriota bacterium]